MSCRDWYNPMGVLKMNDFTKTQRDYVLPDFTKNIIIESTPQDGNNNYFRERYMKLLGMDNNKDKADAFAYAMYGPGNKIMVDKMLMTSGPFSATMEDIAKDPGIPGMLQMPQIKLRRYETLKPPKFLKDKPTLKFKDGKWI